jgi:hypothetical protein
MITTDADFDVIARTDAIKNVATTLPDDRE